MSSPNPLTAEEIRRAFAEPADAEDFSTAPPRAGLSRSIDCLLAAAGLLLAAPLLVVASVAIRLGSPGPVVYRQTRVGRDETPFSLLKLRTMRLGSDPIGVGTAIGEDDPRITPIGRVLRRFSIDELPNLVNVLRSEMAIVGPRPTIPSQVELFSDRQRRRHAVRPGMTGWAQTNGRVGLGWGERIELDLWYVEHRSPALDLKILARSVGLVASGRGLYTGG